MRLCTAPCGARDSVGTGWAAIHAATDSMSSLRSARAMSAMQSGARACRMPSRQAPIWVQIANFGQYTTSYNGDGGMIKGAELTVSVPLELVAPVLGGFGVMASTSYTKSGIDIKQINSTIGKIELPGLSRNVSNLTLYYEKAGFSTRISGRHRSDFVGEIGDFAGDRQLRTGAHALALGRLRAKQDRAGGCYPTGKAEGQP